MSEEIKSEIIVAWNRYSGEHSRRVRKNEGSATQHEDYCRLFKQGVIEHPKLSKKEKSEILTQLGFAPELA